MAGIRKWEGDQVGQGGTSEVHSTQHGELGALYRGSSGDVYMYVDFQEAMLIGEWVVISSTFTASQITSTSKGLVGVVRGTVSASDRFGYVQVYGAVTRTFSTSDVTTSGLLQVTATTEVGRVDELDTSTEGLIVHGAWATGAASTSGISSEFASSRVVAVTAVFLNWPYVIGTAEGTGITS